MKLKDCKLGVIVNLTVDKEKIGHVVGLGIAKYDVGHETVPCVHFSDEKHSRKIHHGNIEIYNN